MGCSNDSDEMREAAERVGRTLRDKWHLDALIDVGGMAAVYAATHRNGLRGAVKILHKHLSRDLDIVDRFAREGRIANKVAHPNSVSVLDDDADDGCVFLVMELLEGSTLRERAAAEGGKLPADEVLLAADKVLDVLAVAHDQSIVHRDVKPDNLFVTTDGRIKVLDFGIAKLDEPADTDHLVTLSGLPMGTPAFMSPEQARGRWDLVGPQSDLWSLGATMFLLLTGQQAHTEETVLELLSAIFNKPAPSLATVLPDCHPGLARVVDRALQLHLAERWADARAMQAAVRAVRREMYGASLPPVTLELAAPQPGALHPGMAGARAPGSATTRIVRARTGRPGRGAVAWRVAIASACVSAVLLGVAGARRGSPPAVAAVPVAAAPVTSAPPSPAVLATAAGLSFAIPEVPLAPEATGVPEAGAPAPRLRPRRKLPASAASVVRPRPPSVYDRRF